MSTHYVAEVNLVTEMCCNCHTVFAMSQALYYQRRNDHKTFYCPLGHAQKYVIESEEERLKRLVSKKDQCCVAAQEEAALAKEEVVRQRKRFAGLKGHVAKLKRRTECPANA